MPQISATVSDAVVDSVKATANNENRTFSAMVEILLKEAVVKRTVKAWNKANPIPKKQSSKTKKV